MLSKPAKVTYKCDFVSLIDLSFSVLSSEGERKNLLKEIQKMASFEHVNVMILIGVCLDGEMPLIIMPFMTKGCVLDYVRHKKDEQLQVSS